MSAYIGNVVSRQKNLSYWDSEMRKKVVPEAHQSALANGSKGLYVKFSAFSRCYAISKIDESEVNSAPVFEVDMLVFHRHPFSAGRPPRRPMRQARRDDHLCVIWLPSRQSV